MKMYCVEHAIRDYENAYFESKEEAIAQAKKEQELIANDEAFEDEIWVTQGEMIDGDYSSECSIEFDEE